MIHLSVVGETEDEVRRDLEVLARAFGLAGTPTPVVAQVSAGTVTATAEAPMKKRGRPSKADKAAAELAGPSTPEPQDDPWGPDPAPEPEPEADDPFGEPAEPTVDLEAVKAKTLVRLQTVASAPGGKDTINALVTKYGNGATKFAQFPLDAFPKIAKDLDTLEV